MHKSYGSAALWLSVTLFLVYASFTRGHFWTVDEVLVFQQTRSLWQRGDLSVEPLINTAVGRDGRSFAPYGAGQSALALPLYGFGKIAGEALDGLGAQGAKSLIAGPMIGEPNRQFGGQTEIFFVGLFNAFVVAALGGVFFAFSLRLGAAPGWAAAAALLVAFTTHIAGFGANFFQHGAESLLLLWTFYFLFADSQSPSARLLACAGATAFVMMQVRISTAALLPVLAAYLFWSRWNRLGNGMVPSAKAISVVRQCLPFLLLTAAGALTAATVNYLKFGEFSVRGVYARMVPLDGTPLLVGLYGNLFSVGSSIFLFSPLLVAAPVYFRSFARKRPPETVAILTMSTLSLALYSKAYLWHGQMCFGPRYLVHLIPLLLLPLGPWLQMARPRVRVAVGALAAAGLCIQILHIAVNVSYAYAHENYFSMQPAYAYLFLPDKSQILAHWRALWAWDYRVDLWTIGLFRAGKTTEAFGVLLVLASALCLAGSKLRLQLRRADAAWNEGVRPSFASLAPSGLWILGWIWAATLALLLFGRR
jgi:hypothetical protein